MREPQHVQNVKENWVKLATSARDAVVVCWHRGFSSIISETISIQRRGSKVNLTVCSVDINLTVTLWCMLFLSPCQQQVWPLIFISVDKVVHTTDCGTDHITVSEYLHGEQGGQSGSTPHHTVWISARLGKHNLEDMSLTHPWQEKWTTPIIEPHAQFELAACFFLSKNEKSRQFDLTTSNKCF